MNRDTVGIIARTVDDVARVLGAVAGYDAADPQTALVQTQTQPDDWTQPEVVLLYACCRLQGANIGVLNSFAEAATSDVATLFDTALNDLKSLGASVVDINITGNSLGADWDGSAGAGNSTMLGSGVWSSSPGNWESLWACQSTFVEDVNAYLAHAATTNPQLRYKTVQALVQGGGIDPSIAAGMVAAAQVNYTSAQYPPPWLRAQGLRCGCLQYWQDVCRAEFRKNQMGSMDAANVQAIVYPTWGAPPQLLTEVDEYTEESADAAQNYSPSVAPHTGAPAITVPMGFTPSGLPTGLQILARPWDEENLLKFAYAYEQQTHHRRPPALFPPASPPATLPNGGSSAKATLQNSSASSALQSAESGR